MNQNLGLSSEQESFETHQTACMNKITLTLLRNPCVPATFTFVVHPIGFFTSKRYARNPLLHTPTSTITASMLSRNTEARVVILAFFVCCVRAPTTQKDPRPIVYWGYAM